MATSKPKEWSDFPLEQYQQEASRLVHFSSKTVNSNAPPCGVRVSREGGLDLPVVGVRTLLVDGVAVPLDYTKLGKAGPIVKQLWFVGSGQAPEAMTQQIRDIQRVTDQATQSAYEEGTEWVSPRLRQLLLPKDGGQYVTVTPLGSSGFSAVLNQKLDTLVKQKKRFCRAWLGIGGQKFWNVGALANEMRKPLLFSAPRENLLERRVLAIHYKGISLGLPRQPLDAYCLWRERQLRDHDGVMLSTMGIRQREAELIGDITHVVMRRGQRARELLESNRHLLPVTPDADSLLSLELKDAVVPGLIEPAARDTAWAYEFGRRLARAIESELRTKWDMPLAGSAVEQIARWIEEAVR